jgi:PAS domain-containing protein
MAMPLFAALVALGLLVVVLGALLLHLASRLRASRTAVAESEHRLLLALDGAGHGVWDWNAETGRVF